MGHSKYRTYQPDDDGIIPIYRGIGMEDGLTSQLIGLLKLIYGETLSADLLRRSPSVATIMSLPA